LAVFNVSYSYQESGKKMLWKEDWGGFGTSCGWMMVDWRNKLCIGRQIL